MSSVNRQQNRNSLIVLAVLGVWLIALLAASIWFQQQYVQPFAQDVRFIQPDQTQHWFNDFKSAHPELSHLAGESLVIQFWQPECLCNQFARPHAVSAQTLSTQLGVRHITLIPSRFADQVAQLQALNPDTEVIALSANAAYFAQHPMPKSPSLILQTANGDIHYFGPLGFGAFCSQNNTQLLDRQLQTLSNPSAQPFFNTLGQGCFCPWQ